ncbi:MAG: acylneuraminate cytidylyltransferase family protein [Proteobacteria bacterium]|nr:acylneuraminate cytidylyltransferase family protein [Pseudomonadota bacterium]
MIHGKSVLGIIPARGGSKGLPGKNILPMCGKPLIGWTINTAKKSRYLDSILVTTDDKKIANIAKSFGAYVPFIRPAEFATDQSSTYDVIRHAVSYFKDVECKEFDYIVLLEPTSPLREDDDIDKMLELIVARENEYDSIISVGEVTEHPSIMKRLVADGIEPFCPSLSQTTRRQDNTAAYFPFAVAYIAKTSSLLEENTFYTRRCMHFLIKRYQNYEIDDIYQFLCAESVMKYEWGLQ